MVRFTFGSFSGSVEDMLKGAHMEAEKPIKKDGKNPGEKWSDLELHQWQW